MPVPNVLVSVGELSGDLYACRMIEALRRRWGEAVHFWGMGGPETAAAGVEVVVPMTDLQVHGVVEVLPNLIRLFRAFRRLTSSGIPTSSSSGVIPRILTGPAERPSCGSFKKSPIE